MLFKRDLSQSLKRYTKFPVVALLGPRQSGKTTLSKHFFDKHVFVSLEDPQLRSFATEDPKRFLREHENQHGIIIDEFQYVPQLLSYIQLEVDAHQRPGYFILTGSQNFLMNQAITQSLAGRVGILTLLPLSLNELESNKLLIDVETTLLNGGYPRLHNQQLLPTDVYPSYTHTYVERDVRQLANVGDIVVFQKFMRLCAARIGQLLNIADLSTSLGVDQRTIKRWLSVLEASYIAFRLKPYFNNFNKRVTKTPKLYFYDTGLACSLLDIKTTKNVALSPHRGHLFESLILADLLKQYHNLGLEPSLYFWRDQNGRIEIDGLIDRGHELIPIEIKAGETIVPTYFKQLLEWNETTKTTADNNIVIYAGTQKQRRTTGTILGWQQATDLIAQLHQ